jgi:membrane-bound lytic murein transglycosylase D
MNRYIQAEIKRFTTGGEKRFFEQSYQRSGQYRPNIVQALKEAGLPEELSWLPLIESGFKTKALSKARALGLWQFIPSTGYKFGLQRNSYIDERMDFAKATEAAIAYLKALHNIFGDWATVLAAYNCGEGRVLQVIRTQNINYLDNFWDLYQRLPMETARYVPRFFATLHIVKKLDTYGMQNLMPDPSLSFDTVTINREIRLKDVAAATQIDLKTLSTLNPELRYSIIPPQEYQLRIPKGYLDDGLPEKLAAIPTTRLPQQAYAWHVVRSGDTLSTIARRYGSSVRKIMRANNLRSSFIRAGKRLKVPKKGYNAGQVASGPTAPIPSSGIHWVRKGDSLWKIARRYGITVKQIMSINSLTSSDLHIGQKLKIAASRPAPLPDPSQLKSYLVRKGDSPYTIAQRHNMALDRFLRINQLTPNSRIYPGQKLSIE